MPVFLFALKAARFSQNSIITRKSQNFMVTQTPVQIEMWIKTMHSKLLKLLYRMDYLFSASLSLARLLAHVTTNNNYW